MLTQLLSLAYLVAYHVVINLGGGVYSAEVIRVVVSRWFIVVFTAMQLGLFASLWHLLPTHATPFSALGTCALSTYLVYLGPIENFALTYLDGHLTQFVNSNYQPFTEVLELALLALVLYVATAFSFGPQRAVTSAAMGVGPRLPRVQAARGRPSPRSTSRAACSRWAWRGSSSSACRACSHCARGAPAAAAARELDPQGSQRSRDVDQS